MLALGLMSGTSMDGIDAALLRTDGVAEIEPVAARSTPYDALMRAAIRDAVADPHNTARVAAVEAALTECHGAAVAELCAETGLVPSAIDVIGFHGQTILHDPERRVTLQIGDGARLAQLTGCRVVNDFRSADMKAGGEGAPLAPIFHAALAAGLADDAAMPLCVLNIGGVANLTWIGGAGGLDDAAIFDRLLAFDTGPGGALLDDWVNRHTGALYDDDGALAASGRVDKAALARLLDHPYFRHPAPKSLDRNDFDPAPVATLSAADGAATLLAFTIESIALARDLLPAAPRRWLVTGGGRRNSALMTALAARLGVAVDPVEAVGWDGDILEAQAFAYLAVRRMRGLPASGPTTTGAALPVVGGTVCEAG